jgi:hypothetical protein
MFYFIVVVMCNTHLSKEKTKLGGPLDGPLRHNARECKAVQASESLHR